MQSDAGISCRDMGIEIEYVHTNVQLYGGRALP